MGLDSFWRPPANSDIIPPTFDPPLKLCGGMFSANGEGSFRGKVYNDIIQRVTGESLYHEEIDNDTVLKMAADLEGAMPQGPQPASVYGNPCDWEYTDEELRDIVRMFRAYADAGYTLHGWW